MKRLEGKTIAIIGATGGIGDPMCRYFRKEGANLLLGARDIKKLRALREAVDPSGKYTISLPTDACVPSRVTDLLEAGAKRFGAVDEVLITLGRWVKTSVNDSPELASKSLEQLFAGMLHPSFNAIFEAQKFLRKQRKGLIVNVSSWVVMHDEEKLRGNVAYRMVKHAIEELLISIQPVLKEAHVRFVNLRPALVDTPTNRIECTDVTEKEWEGAVKPEEVAAWNAENLDNKNIPNEMYFDSDVVE